MILTSPNVISSRYIHTYHHNNSLLFQFILVEFIETFEIIQKLEALSGCKPAPIPTDETITQLTQAQKEEMNMLLAKLVGSTRDYMRIFSWNFNEGLVAKLKTYCILFLQHADAEEKELMAMQHYVDKIWQSCFQAQDSLYDGPKARSLLVGAIEKASSAMDRFAKVIARALVDFRDDENVIFFVLCYKERLDQLYGNRFVAKLLLRLYPKGLKDLQYTLSKRYSSRGFDNLLPIIAEKISEVEHV